jgi:hypothetical protein
MLSLPDDTHLGVQLLRAVWPARARRARPAVGATAPPSPRPGNAGLDECDCDCDCDLEHPNSVCKVHLLMTACQYYIAAVDTEWYALAPWYRGMPKYRKIVDPASLYEAIGFTGRSLFLEAVGGHEPARGRVSDIRSRWRGHSQWPPRRSYRPLIRIRESTQERRGWAPLLQEPPLRRQPAPRCHRPEHRLGRRGRLHRIGGARF